MLIVSLCFLAATPFLARRFLEPAGGPRALSWLYFAVLSGIALAAVGVLGFLTLFLAPHWLMAALGIGCLHGDHCLHGLPLWAQSGMWMLTVALLGWLLWKMGSSAAMTLRASRRVRNAALADGIRLESSAPYPVYETGDQVMVACTIGVFRPLVLVSRELRRSLSREEYEVVLAHEQAHAAGRDNLLLFVAHVIESTLFFVPGARQAHRGLRCSLEIAADAFATKSTGDPLLVASSLNHVASLVFESAKAGRMYPQAAASFGQEELVVERVRHLVFAQGRIYRRRRLLCAIATLVLVFSVLGSSISVVTGHNLVGSSQAVVCVSTPESAGHGANR